MFGFIAIMASCQTPVQEDELPNVYYDVEGFIRDQIELLNEEKPLVKKNMVVSEERESRTTRQVDWNKELELFLQSDINKPAYRKSYAIVQSDSLTFEYTLNTEEDLPVRYLRVVLNDSTGKPDLLEARLLSENKLYESRKNLRLSCGMRKGEWRIVSYQIQGFQELITSSRKPFDVQATIL